MAIADDTERVKSIFQGDELEELYFLFARAHYAVFRDREKELQRHSLTPEQAQVLFVVQALGKNCIPAAMARILIRQPHTMSAIIDHMVDRGLLKKVKDMERKNWVRVTITEKGEKAAGMAKKADPIRRVLGLLNQEERRTFYGYLERILTKASDELGLNHDNLPPSD